MVKHQQVRKNELAKNAQIESQKPSSTFDEILGKHIDSKLPANLISNNFNQQLYHRPSSIC